MTLPTPSVGRHRLLADRTVRRLLRIAGWLAVVLFFVVGIAVLVMRYAVLPKVGDYRPDIEQALSRSLGQPVTIAEVEGKWFRLWPRLHIRGVAIRDAEGNTALALDEIEADVGWSSLWHLEPHFARLEIAHPNLALRRDAQGRLFVAGLELKPDQKGGGFTEWLFDQDRIVIRDAAITWNDELRGAPPLALAQVNLDLRNGWRRHRFGLTAEPPADLASKLDVRGDLRGSSADPASWTGTMYAGLDYTDLAAWHTWVDYPIELPRGSGGLHLWLGIDDRQLASLTADLRLSDVAVRLRPELPMLELDRADGRLSASRIDGELRIGARHLALATSAGLQVGPTDFEARWQPSADGEPARGEVSASSLDLDTLVALADYLPFNPDWRQRLLAYAPRGRIGDMRLAWSFDGERLKNYAVKARFEDLGLKAHGILPGFAGLDGRIDGNERGGDLTLASRDTDVELPAVFAEPVMTLRQLDARATWVASGQNVDVRIEQASFHNDDAAGEASGHYRTNGQGPGEIDLTARLTRAAGGAVWRYMPLVVNQQTRDWLQRSIVGGKATATLRLKGDLHHFPFKDGSGIFEVKGPFQEATLRYAPGWPEFNDVVGDLDFTGPRMIIRAKQAKLWGVTLANVKAEIPDLGDHEQMMTITGSAQGPTDDFLRFIEASPVGNRIGHFTAGMNGSGNGELQLRLEMPLHHIVDTTVEGHYRFDDNGLVYDPDMPPLANVGGELHFTGDALSAKRIRANLLGAPMTLDVATRDGRVAVTAAGSLTVQGLRRQYGLPLFDHLAGSANWTGTFEVGKGSSDVRIGSTLQGISSSLPEPFNKTVSAAMPLRIERRPDNGRDLLTVRLGDAMQARLIRRHEGSKIVTEQGMIAIGRPELRLPARGVLLAVQSRNLDVDLWRRMFNGGGNGGGDGASSISQVDLRADELRIFGRTVHELQLTGDRDEDAWRLDLASREANGKLTWRGADQGHLSAHLVRFALPEGPATIGATVDATSSMPAIDLVIDHFLLAGRDLGELKAEAENREGAWTGNFAVRNDDGAIEGNGRWRPSPTQSQTQAEIKLTAKSIEKFLARFGYPNAIKRGAASLEGKLSWAGAPTALDYASLNGELKLSASNGQFNKLDPGVGRLLGILSLQALPRRISLDFRDIFSEGFAFDSINGNFALSHGVMETKDLQIQGPAAKVLMNGKVDLVRETQDLKVRVQPALGESVATGVLLVNPAVGAATWVMNKVFGNPIDKAFAFDYTVTGSWNDPKVEKVSVQGPAPPKAIEAVP